MTLIGEQSDARERRSRADLQWTINRRRPVIGDFMSLESMVLRRGITSFFNWDERGPIPEFSFSEFKRVVYGVADSLRLAVSSVNERGVTPNFHSARLDDANTSATMLGHSTYPIFAFSRPLEDGKCQMQFVDCDPIATELLRLFPELTVLTASELNRKTTESNLDSLDPIELEQIEYWKPQSVGEIAFNWWD